MTTTAAVPDLPIAQVRVPERSFVSDIRAIKIVWHREILRFKADRARIMVSLIQPVLYLFVLGTGYQMLRLRQRHGKPATLR